ncbi:MAG TPA: 23S rRNA (pseudouridine(1915)-N(3))-methyltransferase RlmH [Chlamydiales bacterium]|nr:23S rRNA (pseudouridine(1915)-N(3))-methyltransferase RlmH [Chlamydiales bacterium]
MFKVKVITEGKIKEPWLIEALSMYEKRLKGKMEIEWVIVDDLEEKVLKEPSFIALDIQGKSISSEQMSRSLFNEWGSRPTFVIGGAVGLSQKVLHAAKYRISFSSLTFTHQMVRLILVEQLYRALEIEEGSSYHK